MQYTEIYSSVNHSQNNAKVIYVIFEKLFEIPCISSNLLLKKNDVFGYAIKIWSQAKELIVLFAIERGRDSKPQDRLYKT